MKNKEIVEKFFGKIKGKVFCIYDTETTGLSPKNADIIEFSALKVNGDTLEIIETFDTFVNPGYELPQEIVEFNEKNNTGITPEKISSAPDKEFAAKKIREFLGENPIVVGHNSIKFDTAFVNKLYQEVLEEEFSPDFQLDTLVLAKEKVEGSHKLADLYKTVCEDEELPFHTSLGDVYATLEVLKWLLPMYDAEEEEDEVLHITKVQRWKKSATLDRIYINNKENASIYYDVVNSEWECSKYDNDFVKKLVYDYTEVSDDEELVRKYGG